MSKHTFRLGAAALASAAVLGATGAGAGATTSATPATLSGVQAKAAAAITLRVNDLNAAIAKVNAAKGLGSGAATLDSYLQANIAPLQALGQKIAADQTVAEAQTDAATIYTNFRVLALVLPAADLAGDSDAIINGAVPTLTADSAKVAARVNPSNQAVLQPLIDDLNSQISTASSDTSGLAATVLAFTPAQWNANNAVLSASRSSKDAAAKAIGQARTDLQEIRADLKGTHPPKAQSPAAGTTPTTAPVTEG